MDGELDPGAVVDHVADQCVASISNDRGELVGYHHGVAGCHGDQEARHAVSVELGHRDGTVGADADLDVHEAGAGIARHRRVAELVDRLALALCAQEADHPGRGGEVGRDIVDPGRRRLGGAAGQHLHALGDADLIGRHEGRAERPAHAVARDIHIELVEVAHIDVLDVLVVLVGLREVAEGVPHKKLVGA